MCDALAQFPLEMAGLINKPREHVIMGTHGWILNVGDIIDARQNRNPDLEQLCRDFGLNSHGDSALLKDRIAHHFRYLKMKAAK